MDSSIFTAPGPLLHVGQSIYMSYDVGTWQLVISYNPDTMFYFDGKYIREAASHRCLSPDNYRNNAEIYLTTSCTHVVLFQYDVKESELFFWDKPASSVHVQGGVAIPGKTMVVHTERMKYTLMNRGKPFLAVCTW